MDGVMFGRGEIWQAREIAAPACVIARKKSGITTLLRAIAHRRYHLFRCRHMAYWHVGVLFFKSVAKTTARRRVMWRLGAWEWRGSVEMAVACGM